MPQPYEKVKLKRRDILINNLLGGISWSLGATLGFSLILAVLALVLRQISLVPVIGSFVTQISDFVMKNSHR